MPTDPRVFMYGVAPGISQAAASIMSGLLERERADQVADRFRMSSEQQKQQFAQQHELAVAGAAMQYATRSVGDQPVMDSALSGMRRGTDGVEDPVTGHRWYGDDGKPVDPGETAALMASLNEAGVDLIRGGVLATDNATRLSRMAQVYGNNVQEGDKTFAELYDAAPPEVRNDAAKFDRYLQGAAPQVFNRINAARQAQLLARQQQFATHEEAVKEWRTRWITAYNEFAQRHGAQALEAMPATTKEAIGLVQGLTGTDPTAGPAVTPAAGTPAAATDPGSAAAAAPTASAPQAARAAGPLPEDEATAIAQQLVAAGDDVNAALRVLSAVPSDRREQVVALADTLQRQALTATSAPRGEVALPPAPGGGYAFPPGSAEAQLFGPQQLSPLEIVAAERRRQLEQRRTEEPRARVPAPPPSRGWLPDNWRRY